MRDGKVLIFCSDRWDAKEFEREHLKELQAIMTVLGLEKGAYEITWANGGVDGIISAPETKVVVTYGCLYRIQEKATRAGKFTISYEKENERFVSLRTIKSDLAGIEMFSSERGTLI